MRMGALGRKGHRQCKNKASRGKLWGQRTEFGLYDRGNFPGHHVLGCLTKIGIDGFRWVQNGLVGCVCTHRQVGSNKPGVVTNCFDRFITILGGGKKIRNGVGRLRTNFKQSRFHVYLNFHHKI